MKDSRPAWLACAQLYLDLDNSGYFLHGDFSIQTSHSVMKIKSIISITVLV